MAALRWLTLILVVAAALRTMGLAYQLPLPAGPDPLGLIAVALRMGTGDLNPHMFTWPAGPFYLMAGCYGAMFVACRVLGVVADAGEFKRWFLDDPSVFFLVARLIMVTVGLISVVMIYRVGRLLGSRRQGLWAAAMLAVTPVEVIFCHYQKAEPLLVLATLAALATLIRWWDRDSAGRAALAGAAIGLACAVKYNAVALVVPAVATLIHHAFGAWQGRWQRRLISRLALGVVCLLVVFFALNPYLLIDAREAWHQLSGQKQLMDVGRDGIHRTPARSYLTLALPTALGWMLYAIYGAGLAWLAVRAIRRRTVEVILVMFVLAYCAAMMTQNLVTAYYPLPMVPALALGAAGMVCAMARRIRPAAWVVGVLLVAPAGRSIILVYELALPSPTFRAEYWIRDNVPAGDRLVHRQWLAPLLSAHRHRIGCYVWPLEPQLHREQVQAFVDRGVRWIVLNTSRTAGHEDELFGPAEAPLAREVQRFDAPRSLLPVSGGGTVILQVCQPAKVPPLARAYGDPEDARPGLRLDATFEGGVTLLGVDPPGSEPIRPGDTVELSTYWRVPGEARGRWLITGEIAGAGGVLGDLTHDLAYGIEPFVSRSVGQACVVSHRILVRVGYRAKPGDYDVRVGLRVVDRRGDLPIVKGPGAPGKRCTAARVSVRR